MTQRIAVLYGGRSGEHDVSCVSALSVLRALDPAAYEVTAVGITLDGRFVVPPAAVLDEALHRSVEGPAIADALAATGEEVWLVAGKVPGSMRIVSASSAADTIAEVDVVFPVLHGPYGEDGIIQGFLDTLGVPYVGSGVLGSAVAMDKVVMRQAFAAEGLPLLPWASFDETRRPDAVRQADLVERLGLPLFVKPANLGSSVGIERVDVADALGPAIERALAWDHRIVIEKGASIRELECAVLGGHDAVATPPGEIIVNSASGWYDYDAKYVDPTASSVQIPAELPPGVAERTQALALAAFAALDCWGLARVDIFYDEADDELYVNEVNTLPGFTKISMWPKLFQHEGLDYPDQIARLLELAVERHDLLARRSRRS